MRAVAPASGCNRWKHGEGTAMTDGRLGLIVRQLRSLAGPPGDELPDAELLRHFATRQDAAALETLVARHGPLVLGVCRRLLGDSPDAEDAFQATFLVFARRARALRPAG